MKINHTINIDIKDFLLNGKFDLIQTGQTKEWIVNNFLKPVRDAQMGNNLSICTFSTIEFHFDGDKLYLIWCDNLSIRSNKYLKFDKWILKNLAKLTFRYVTAILNNEKANYTVKFDKQLQNVVLKIKNSSVCLWFENINDDKIDDPNGYKLVAFGLSDKEYDTFEIDFN